MRYLFGFVCVCALGLVPLVGCSDTQREDTWPICERAEDCNDDNECTDDACRPDGICTNAVLADASECDFGGRPGLCRSGVCEDAMLCEDVECYGCVSNATLYAFEMILNVDPGTVAANSPFDVTFSGEALLPDEFPLVEARFSFDHAEVGAGAAIPVTALSGATGADVVLTMETITRDFDTDPEPFVIPILSGSGTFDAGASGTDACFNFGKGMEFTVTITELGGEPGLLPIPYSCQPANQESLNAYPRVLTPEADAGQVCFTIP